MAAVRRLVCHLSSIPSFGASKSKVSSFQRAIFDPLSISGTSHFSQLVKSNGKQLFLFDTSDLVTRLEEEGVSSKQAEAVIAATTEVLNDGIERLSQSMASQEEMQKIEMMQESKLFKFKEVVLRSQQQQLSQLLNETEKVRNDLEKMRIDVRDGRDKLTAEYRLELQFEMGMQETKGEHIQTED